MKRLKCSQSVHINKKKITMNHSKRPLSLIYHPSTGPNCPQVKQNGYCPISAAFSSQWLTYKTMEHDIIFYCCLQAVALLKAALDFPTDCLHC